MVTQEQRQRRAEIGCDACFEQLDRFAEMRLAGKSAAEALPLGEADDSLVLFSAGARLTARRVNDGSLVWKSDQLRARQEMTSQFVSFAPSPYRVSPPRATAY